MVLDMTNNERKSAELLERVIMEMEARTSKRTVCPSVVNGDSNSVIPTRPCDSLVYSGNQSSHTESGMTGSWETDQLLELLGKVLQQAMSYFPDTDELRDLQAYLDEVNKSPSYCSVF